ncbi:MAG: PEGA domain-containing protein [Kofleriaceae bacterium]|nr:PEGA domain-containing protein [Kofleriaceae bacterium]
MPKQENTAINNLVNVAGGGRIESDPGDNLFGDEPLFGGRPVNHRAQLMEAQPAMTMRGMPPAASPPTPARSAQSDARARSPQAHVPMTSRAYAAQPSRSMESMQTITRDPYASRDAFEGKPTRSMRPQRRPDASPYAPTEPVRDLAHAPTEPVRDLAGTARGQAHPAARVPQPNVPVAPLPRHRAPAASPSVFPGTPSTPITARNVQVPTLPSYTPAPNVGDPEELYATLPVERIAVQDSTALVHARPRSRTGPRPFVVELAHAIKGLAAPIGVLTVVAMFVGGYLAFDGQGGKKRSTAVVSVQPTARVAPSLADAVIAVDPSLAAEHVATEAALVPAPAPVAPPASAPAPAVEQAPALEQIAATAEDDATDEIEMEATTVEKKKRSARSRRSRSADEVALAEDDAASKRRSVEKKSVLTRSEKAAAKRASKVAEGELPPNVADKTNGGPGKLVVSADVPALIYLDGRNTNLTAPKKITVPAGKHKVTLLDPETRKAKTQEVEVVAGKTVTIEKQFN